MAYNFTQTARVCKWEVKVDPVAHYGYFEHDTYGEGGGLWFEGNDLSDYDGVFALPMGVVEAIRSLGYSVDDTCY